MKKINISTPKYPNTFAIVDDCDYEYLNQWKWTAEFVGTSLYAYKKFPLAKYKRIKRSMHGFLMETPKGMHTDHINHNGLDNRRCNLRICNGTQNNANRKLEKTGCQSIYKGVRIGCCQKWRASIMKDYKRINLGTHILEIEAAKAYNCAARILFGEYAYENKI